MLDISSTANRADSLSIKGIAKEISALIDKPILQVKYNDKNLKYLESFRENITDT